MLEVTPVSWIGQIAFSASSYPVQLVLGRLKDDCRPYAFSNKVLSGDKNFLGNRDCYHYQFHGQAFYNDCNWPVKDIEKRTVESDWLKYAGLRQLIGIPFRANQPWMFTTFVAHQYSDDWHWYEAGNEPLVIRLGHIGLLQYAIRGQFVTYTGSYGAKWQLRLEVVEAAWYDPTKRYFLTPIMEPTTFSVKLPCGRCSTTRESYTSTNWIITSGEVSDDLVSKWDNQIGWKKTALRSFIRQIELALAKSTVSTQFPTHSTLNSRDPAKKLKSSMLHTLKVRIEDQGRACEPEDEVTPIILYGDASQSAADAAKNFDGNTATLAKELFTLKESIMDLIKMLRGKADAKSVSSLFLSAKYGLRLTAQDTIELAKAVKKTVREERQPLYATARGGASDTYNVVRCKIYYDKTTRNALAKYSEAAMSWDLFPSFQNVWDIIPYSFVVDWFADVEGFLTAIDANTYLSVMNVISVLYSRKKQWHRPLNMNRENLIGNIRYSQYSRWSQKEAYPPIPHFSGGQPSKHIIEGAALIIQRL